MKKIAVLVLAACIAMPAPGFSQNKKWDGATPPSAPAKPAKSSGRTSRQARAAAALKLPGAAQRQAPGLAKFLQPPAAAATVAKKDELHPPPAPNAGPQTPYAPAVNPAPLPIRQARHEDEEDPDNLVRQWERWPSIKDQKQAVHDALAMRPPSSTAKAANPAGALSPQAPVTNAWSQIGYGDYNLDGVHHRAGRIRQASYAYDNAQGITTLWLGASGGGLWRGVVLNLFAVAFVPVSDTLPGSPGVGAFLVQPGNSNNILIGSGDLKRYGGTGMYKTIDGGATWQAVNPTDGTTWPSAFVKVLIDVGDPTNQTVLAAGSNAGAGTGGIWRSTDFGSTWTKVYTGDVTDLVQDSVYTYIWYAGAPGIGVLRSTSYGSYYAPVGTGMNAPGRVAVAVSPAAPWHVYAISATASNELAGIWRSDSYGDGTWNQIETNDNIGGGLGQAFHTTSIAVDPTNADVVFAGMVYAQVTYNATAATPSWKYSSSDFDDGHTDHTGFVFEPGTSNVIETSDGGVYVLNRDTLALNTNLNYATNLNVQELFGWGANDLACSATVADQCLSGLQDNAVVTVDRYSNPPIVDVGLGGDGGQVSISPDNSSEMFAMRNGARFYTFTPFSGWTGDYGNCLPGGANYYATTMLDQTPAVGFAPYIYTIAGPDVYYKGVNPNCDWSMANSPLTPLPATPYVMDASNDPRAYVFYTVPKDSAKLYVMDSYSDGPIGSMTYEDRTPPLLYGSKGTDGRVAADRSNLRAYTVTYVTATSLPSAAYISNDRGQTWANVTGDLSWKLPVGVAFLKLVANPGDQSNLFLATTTGVYRSDNGGVNWYQYSDGLPAVVIVADITLNYDHSTPPLLHIGTFGRGFWDRSVAPDSVLAGSSINPSNFVGGHPVDYVVWLDRPAPVDTTITLTSSDPGIFPVPATVTIAAGYSNAGIVVSTPLVTSQVTVQVLAKYNGVTQSALATVTPEYPTSTVVTSSLNPAVYGQTVTFTSTTTSQVAGTIKGQVIFYDGPNPLGPPVTITGGVASLAVPGLAAVVHGITASYQGDSYYAVSTSPILYETVNAASTSTALAAAPNPSAFGQTVGLTATVTSPAGAVFAGSVAFLDGSTQLGTVGVNASGVAALNWAGLAVGSHTLSAQYTGSTDFLASTSTAVAGKVVPATTQTRLTAAPNPAKKGQVVTLTAVVVPQYTGTPTGTVKFKDGTVVLGTVTLSSGQASLKVSTLAVGTHTIKAVYSGSTQFTRSTSLAVKEVITN